MLMIMFITNDIIDQEPAFLASEVNQSLSPQPLALGFKS